MIALIDDGTITGPIAKDVFEKMYASGRRAAEIVEAEGLAKIDDRRDRRDRRRRARGDARHRRRIPRRQDQGLRVPRRPGDEGDRRQGGSRASTRACAACSARRRKPCQEGTEERGRAEDEQRGASRSVSKPAASRGVQRVRELSLRIDKGEFVFLTGPSGAGKSTLLRLLLRQERAYGGRLVVGGAISRAVGPPGAGAYRRSIGFVFQDFKLLPNKTVLDNVAFVPRVLGMPPTQQQRRTFQVLKWVGLQHRMNAYPMELSGGEQQRSPSPARW